MSQLKNNLTLNDYEIHNNCIVINSKFDKSINFTMINQIFDKIIFSNFPNYCMMIKFLNDSDNYNVKSEFDSMVKLTNNLTHLAFGYSFNKHVILTNNLTHLSFGYEFNQSICLTNNLIFVQFEYCFNRSINLPDTVLYLGLGGQFAQPIDIPNIKILSIGCNDKNIIDYLPNSLKTLILIYDFNLPLNNLPNQLEQLMIINDYYNKNNNLLNNLPISIEQIELGDYYSDLIYPISSVNLKITKCNVVHKRVYSLNKLDYMFYKDLI